MAWSPFSAIATLRTSKQVQDELAANNQHLAAALEQEKLEGHRMAVIARTIAMVVIMVLLPFLNPNWNVLFYHAFILAYIGLGWLQYRYAKVGYSRVELLLIFLDIIILAVLFTTPNPFQDDEFPTAMLYRFGNFIYFFLILAVASLAYSWRTVWSIGTWIAGIWLFAAMIVEWFGNKIPELDEASREAFGAFPFVQFLLTPNSVNFDIRVQEVVVMVLTAGILAIKGYRSNLLMIRQAEIASERANLSRYFPESLVDTLASTDHDIGAVRSQEVAVLFTDIVGFTKFAERNDPDTVMDLLRDYHAFIEKAIFENNGTLEKYIGDGVMATFGRPEISADDAVHALNAAKDIMRYSTEFNEAREALGQEPIKVSVGLHYGPVIMGDIGPSRRMEFAVIGDTVNVASRLEAETRNLDCTCVVSDDLMQRLNGSADEMLQNLPDLKRKGEVTLRGRSKPVDVWVS